MTYIIWIHFLMKCLKSYILKITFIYIFFWLRKWLKREMFSPYTYQPFLLHINTGYICRGGVISPQKSPNEFSHET